MSLTVKQLILLVLLVASPAMADSTLLNLPAISSVNASDSLYDVPDASHDNKATIAQVEAYLNSTVSRDCTMNGTGAITCTKTNNVNFAPSATTDTTNAANITVGTLPAARLPNPSASTLGGVESLAATTHQWINSISTLGVPSASQPAASDISGLAASATIDTTNASNVTTGTLPAGVLPLATTGAFGAVKPDGTTITVSGGVISSTGGSGTPANPTANVGLTVVNGSATTYMRSDGAPALDQSIAPTWTGQHVFAKNGAVVASGGAGFKYTGTAATGTATTAQPAFYLDAGTEPTTWNVNGTILGINGASGFSGNMIDVHNNGGVSVFSVGPTGVGVFGGNLSANSITAGTTSNLQISGKTSFSSPSVGVWQSGTADAAAPVAQTLAAQSVVAGTSNTAGQNWVIQGSRSTGSGAGGDIDLTASLSVAAATVQNTTQSVLKASHLGGVRLSPGFTVSTLPTTHLAGARAFVTDQTAACVAAGAALTGGGAVTCPVFDNGTTWVGD